MGMKVYRTDPYQAAVLEGLRAVKALVAACGDDDTQVYLVFDNPLTKLNWRKKLDAGYKHPRELNADTAKFYEVLKAFKEIIRCYSDSYRLCYYTGCEADDLVLPIADWIEGHYLGAKSLFVSADLDWARIIAARRHWCNWKDIFDGPGFASRWKFRPEGKALQIYKAIRGDKSDAIHPGVPNLPAVYLAQALRAPSLEAWLANLGTLPQHWQDKISVMLPVLRRNYTLVDFAPPPVSIEEIIYVCKRSPEQSRIWFDTLNLPQESWMAEKRMMLLESLPG